MNSPLITVTLPNRQQRRHSEQPSAERRQFTNAERRARRRRNRQSSRARNR